MGIRIGNEKPAFEIRNANFSLGRNIVSSCCNAPVVTGLKREYPLGGTGWEINYKTEVCEECGQECDCTDVCEGCGEGICRGECSA